MSGVRQFEVCVYLKEGLLDPQGRAVREAMKELGLAVEDVRVGRAVRITMEDTPENREKLQELAENFLANPVIETFELRPLETKE